MPELPEVETTVRGIQPHIVHKSICRVIIREPRLRWPIPNKLDLVLKDQTLQSVSRRAKYILLHFTTGTLLMHLGMSGSLHICHVDRPVRKHDHLDIIFDNLTCLRFHDPRRFGCVLWTADDVKQHKLIRDLGPEPLSDEFDGNFLFQRSRNRRISIKQFIMDSKIVVGVGNIYASESLFYAGIHPTRTVNRIAVSRYEKLVSAIKQVLQLAISQGGTTLRDFTNSEGKPGYFQQQLAVYGKTGESCINCKTTLKHIIQAQRSTYYCPKCQR